MTSPDNILLHLSEDEEQQVREVFACLEERGFPVQKQTPHITVTFAPTMAVGVVQRAAELLPPVIPARFKRVGTVVFGTKRKQTVAWLLETSDELEVAAREISALNPDGRGPRWTPHLTMGLRLPREIVPDYIRALDEVTSPHLKELSAVRAALWKPRIQELTVLAEAERADAADFEPDAYL
ncbi:2'-5' RNA ligase family protein [Corynebacterium halotolerans]|uniref:2'-5' RNA ligase family protein n=1 Tax=Corynebacterium halotolerans TaxID=225326 RepID=UPI003CEAD880